MDATMVRTFGAISSGKGATSEWTSKGKAGRGRAEITESTAPFKIRVEVDFVKPFKAHNINEFILEPRNDMTRITWAWHGPIPFVAQVMSIFVDMEHVMGKHFESGLRSLKTLSEQ